MVIVNYKMQKYLNKYLDNKELNLGSFNKAKPWERPEREIQSDSDQITGVMLKNSSYEYLGLLTDAMPILITYVDSEERYRFNNKTYTDWFGISKEDLFGKTIIEILGEDAYTEIQPYVKAALSGEQLTFETFVSYKNGPSRYVKATYVPHKSGKTVLGYFAMIEDISEEKKLEIMLKTVNIELEQRVIERTTELSKINELLQKEIFERKKIEQELVDKNVELERSNSELEQFAIIASHDLNEPLRSIIGFLNVISEQLKGKLDTNTESYINRTIKATDRLKELINDLLIYSRSGKQLEDELVNCNIAVNNAINNLKILMEENNAIISYDTLKKRFYEKE